MKTNFLTLCVDDDFADCFYSLALTTPELQTFILAKSRPCSNELAFVPFRQMWSTPWGRWPEVMWALQRPMTSPPATRTPSTWWRSMTWRLWWVQCTARLRKNWTLFRAVWNTQIICFWCFCLTASKPSVRKAVFENFGNLEKVREQKDLASFILDTVLKSLNLLYLNKSNREHNKMVMFHVCQMKAFHVDYFGLWLNERQAFVPTSLFYDCE